MRLIDADALKDWSEIVPLTGDGGIDINDFDEKLKSMPTVDAVPVVRCKDCKYWNYEDSGTDGTAQGACSSMCILSDGMFYCAGAVRKEE